MDATFETSPVQSSGYVRRLLPSDPRIFQLLFLGLLLFAGALFRDFSLGLSQIIATFAAAVLAQRVSWMFAPPKSRSYRSALITALSLTLLLRADNLLVHPLAAAAAISSKSLIRVRGKHVFNPATFGVIVALLLLPGSWVSAGQWGADIAYAGWIVALGAVVAARASRADISWTFLGFFLGGAAVRDAWFGYSSAVWAHQLQSGALLLFAFFMISDPMTSPNARAGRLAHAALVGAVALWWQYGMFATNGLLWALFLCAPLVAVWDQIFPAPKFEWNPAGGSHDEVRNCDLSGSTAGGGDTLQAA